MIQGDLANLYLHTSAITVDDSDDLNIGQNETKCCHIPFHRNNNIQDDLAELYLKMIF